MKAVSFQTDVLPLKNELFRMALRLTQNRAEAEDVVQETMLKIWSRREQWDQLNSISAFCLTVCRNVALDKIRQKDNQVQSLDTTYDPADHSHAANPEEQAIQRDRIQKVRHFINLLPEKQRSCMQLRDMEGKSYKDIADILGINEQQVKVNIYRARQAIKEKLMRIEK